MATKTCRADQQFYGSIARLIVTFRDSLFSGSKPIVRAAALLLSRFNGPIPNNLFSVYNSMVKIPLRDRLDVPGRRKSKGGNSCSIQSMLYVRALPRGKKDLDSKLPDYPAGIPEWVLPFWRVGSELKTRGFSELARNCGVENRVPGYPRVIRIRSPLCLQDISRKPEKLTHPHVHRHTGYAHSHMVSRYRLGTMSQQTSTVDLCGKGSVAASRQN